MSADRAAPTVSPAVIRDTLPMAAWNVDRLHRLDLPVHSVRVADLAWLLDLPLWPLDGVRFQVSPRQVRDDPARFPDHLRQVLAADLDRPIHLVGHHGRIVVLDGFHRLLKAVIEGRPEIDAMTLSRQHLESISSKI